MDKLDNIKNLLNKYGSSKEPFLFLLSYDLQKIYIEKSRNLTKNIKYELNSFGNSLLKEYFFKKFPLSFLEYKEKFEKVKEQIRAGNSYLLNLTSQTRIETNLSLDDIYIASNSLLKLRVKIDDLDFVCFSPEKFVEIIDNKIYTYPMKGTIDSNIENAKEVLLNCPKEKAEHTMIVDLLRNDLGRVSKNIKVEEFRTFSKIVTKDKNLLQTSSKISGELKDVEFFNKIGLTHNLLNKDWRDNLGDIMLNLLPAGSITGTPKKSTIDILKDIENYDRGFYTGVFGIFDGKNLQSFVLIRFIEKIEDELFYKSGGGITIDSDVKLEYEELINKVYFPF
ncbi:aminodeoxychorismate synthase, component I [Aliarcobacter faecis]|nr:aminodeoxychorismate synthase component I [Aliarcobacter faecis]QKF74122.1 aminodeoxychorismate synthase, component I [Aliarcobacter faecis]